jgi:hypothetical protein
VDAIESHATAIASDGSFRFTGLKAREGEALVVRVTHQGVNYLSELGAFKPEQQELRLPVRIYEPTEDPAAVLITQMHVFLTRVGQRLEVEEFYVLGNAGDRAYVGQEDPATGRRITMDFVLPAGAQGLGFEGQSIGERFMERPGGFADTQPVLPGAEASEVFFRYDLPFVEGRLITRAIDVPVASVALIVLGSDVALGGADISQPRALDTAVGPALSYTVGPLAAGEPLEFSLVAGGAGSVPGPSESVPTGIARLEVPLGLVALAAGIMVAALLWRSPVPGAVPASVRPLVEAIAALDVEFEAGGLPEERYRAQRDSLKQQIRARLDQ